MTSLIVDEEWMSISGFGGLYEVSNTGRVAKVFDGDRKIMKPHTNSQGYLRVDLTVSGVRHRYFVHRLVATAFIGLPDKMEVDHKNGDFLDNRACNLRVSSSAQNKWNTKISKNNKAGYKGVTYLPKRRKYIAQIMVNYVHHRLGVFDTPQEAHAAYCDAARKHYGDFARFG